MTMRLRRHEPLPAYRVTMSDGTSYVTNMAHGVTLEQARAYFVGNWFEQPYEKPALQAVAVDAA